jgi:small-conductance mechanosensitive channel
MDWEGFLQVFTKPLFHMGDTPFSLATMVQFVVIIVVVMLLARATRRALLKRVLPRTRLDDGLQYMISRIAGYAVLVLGLMVGLQTAGVNLSSLTVLAGAVGIGIGFGLQTIINNFVSGLILMGERSVQIGDRIEMGGINGDVLRIGARSTSVRTNDNIMVIVPNAELVSGRVVNWSHRGDQRLRFRVPVGVSYDNDPHQVEELLLEAASENKSVLKDPAPRAVLKEFGANSLNFELRVWTDEMTHNPTRFKSELNFAIWDKFKKHRIEIPFPQRDIHVKEPLQVEVLQK